MKFNIQKQTISLIAITVLIISSIIFISGCSGVITGGSGTNIYHVGTNGLSMDFFKSNPTSIYEQDDFSMSMFIKNLGTYTINGTSHAKLTISYDSYYIILNSSQKTTSIQLHGTDQDEPRGGEEYYEFLYNARSLDNLRDSVKTNIIYNLCYPYRTELSIGTCIDTKVSSQDERADACKPATYTTSSGQGAPVAITKIEPEVYIASATTARPAFKIYVKNMGDGYVLLRNSTTEDTCNNVDINKTSQTLKKLSVHAYLSNIEMKCDPSIIKLSDTADNYFRCYVNDNETASYSRNRMNYIAPLTITLDYGYVQVVSQEIEIKRKYDFVVQSKICGFYEIELANHSCVTRCDYCASNPSASECKSNINIVNWNGFTKDFSCLCSKSKCTELNGQGLCIFGYCPGDEYCCKTDACVGKIDGYVCGDNYVCIGEKCTTLFTECTWYANNTKDWNYTCLNQAACNTTTIKTGLCPGKDSTVCCKPNLY